MSMSNLIKYSENYSDTSGAQQTSQSRFNIVFRLICQRGNNVVYVNIEIYNVESTFSISKNNVVTFSVDFNNVG